MLSSGVCENLSVLGVLLAAGDSKRMLHCDSKPLVKLAGAPLLKYAFDSLSGLCNNVLVVVNEENRDKIILESRKFCSAELDGSVSFLLQGNKRGTAGALVTVWDHMGRCDMRDYDAVAVSYVDTPFVSVDTMSGMLAEMRLANRDVVVLCFEDNDNERSHGAFKSYGRVVLVDGDNNSVSRIEYGDCSACDSKLLHSGFMLFRSDAVTKLIDVVVSDIGAAEYHITDLVNVLANAGYSLGYKVVDIQEAIGINTLEDLSKAECILQNKLRRVLLKNGVAMISPENVFLSYDTKVGFGTTIYPYVFFGPSVTIGSHSFINSFSYIDNTAIGSGCSVGPFARLSGGNEISDDVNVGNFVELKRSFIGSCTKVKHLAYVGDAIVSEGCNIGAGSVFCNFDGRDKHETIVGSSAFIGANTTLVAPLHIGSGSMVAAGSTVTEDIPDEKLVIARARGVLKNIPA